MRIITSKTNTITTLLTDEGTFRINHTNDEIDYWNYEAGCFVQCSSLKKDEINKALVIFNK